MVRHRHSGIHHSVRMLLSFLLIAGLLAGCAPAAVQPESASSMQVSPSPADTVSPAPTEEADEAEHLPFYDQIDAYNTLWSGGAFLLSEAERDGGLCYRLDGTAYNVTVWMERQEGTNSWTAEVLWDGDSLTFDMPIFLLGAGAASGIASLELADLTGDGLPELIYCYGAGGTGAWQGDCRVFDLSRMAECPVALDFDALAEQIAAEPVEESEEGTLFRVTGPDGAQSLAILPGYSWAEEEDKPGLVLSHYYEVFLDQEAGRLALSLSFSPGGHAAARGYFLGGLDTWMDYDETSHTFSPVFPTTVSVYDWSDDG